MKIKFVGVSVYFGADQFPGLFAVCLDVAFSYGPA